MIALTLCHCRPTKTPTRLCIVVIGVEVDCHFVRFGRYDRRLEVPIIRWLKIREAAAVVHQGRPVPIGDSDKVGGAGVDAAINNNSKVCELKPQYLPTLHSDLFFLVKAVRIVFWVVG